MCRWIPRATLTVTISDNGKAEGFVADPPQEPTAWVCLPKQMNTGMYMLNCPPTATNPEYRPFALLACGYRADCSGTGVEAHPAMTLPGPGYCVCRMMPRRCSEKQIHRISANAWGTISLSPAAISLGADDKSGWLSLCRRWNTHTASGDQARSG